MVAVQIVDLRFEDFEKHRSGFSESGPGAERIPNLVLIAEPPGADVGQQIGDRSCIEPRAFFSGLLLVALLKVRVIHSLRVSWVRRVSASARMTRGRSFTTWRRWVVERPLKSMSASPTTRNAIAPGGCGAVSA